MFKHIVKILMKPFGSYFAYGIMLPYPTSIKNNIIFQEDKFLCRRTAFSTILDFFGYQLHLSICIFQFLCLSKMNENYCPLCFKRIFVFHISKILLLFLGLCGWKILEGKNSDQ